MISPPSALFLHPATAAVDAPFVQGGKAGFVVSKISYALGPDAKDADTCPDGMSLNPVEIFQLTPEAKRHQGESDKDYGSRLDQGGWKIATAANGQNLCMNPEAGGPDPHFRTVKRSDVAVPGINMDGVNTPVGTSNDANSCHHSDFIGINGEAGVDNQFYRLVGCSRSFQTSGASNTYGIEMLTGAWGILISVSGVDDLNNDDEVEVGLYANADPIRLSPGRNPLQYATYAMDQDPRFRATTRGKIQNGVLITEPVTVRFHSIVNSLRLERELQDAQLQMTLSEDGVLDSYLAGYTPVETMYDLQYGYRSGKDSQGELASLKLRLGTANGAARVLGHSCPGAYHALYQLADGNPDPNTGRCTSISTQYRVTAIPAFVVDVKTQSINDALKQTETDDGY
ncbi:hypothetical protein G8770_09760 [Aestuariicella hydrocarbonica]|uniref:Uncharacterized protein n=1 Tax=Pseudomaricurvus hydrocarbonicus TaxID=1470433 RepID=A0A9E5MKU0_9GAMM|nr:hypothetical protein [Aestuariicella hydrocarbonica]NHO65827.1 hypothetical protein [Aestuariicella hydrocarbonica]